MTERSDRSDEVRRASQDEDVGGEQAPAASGKLKGQTRSDDEVAAAEAEVEQSRAELTETIEALKEKLEPQNLEEQAKARARGQHILEAVRRNPKPVAVAGGVLFLLLVRRLRRGGTR